MTTQLSAFAPDWASPPGETLRDVMRERGLPVEEVARQAGIRIDELELLLTGEAEVTLAVAKGLAAAVGSTAQFWVNRECQYRDGLARAELSQWVRSLPTSEMRRLGWIPASRSVEDLFRLCLDFFRVSDHGSLLERRALLETALYRSSRSLSLDDGAALAWLQEARRRAHRLGQVGALRRTELRTTLSRFRHVTLDKNPQSFLPTVESALARSGVRLVVLQAPRGCTISGASLVLDDGSAMIALTARHLSDDHLWFTLYHEAAHLILHDADAIFVDDLDGDERSLDAIESEADEFASDLLVPSELRAELAGRRPTSRDIIRASIRHKVAPGIVVGHLQHEGVLEYRQLNSLKRRYRWNGPTLEKA